MDPLTAFTTITTALLEFLTELMKGQRPDQKQAIWDWYIADVQRWRKFFKLDAPE